MTLWQAIPDERRALFSPIGLRLVDDFAGVAPFGLLRVLLDRQTASGGWEPTAIEGVRTLSDTIIYPGLGRSAHAGVELPSRYRVRVGADHLLPFYLRESDGIEFDAEAWDDVTPPTVVPSVPLNLFLLPAPAYPFPTHVRVLRGTIIGPGGDPAPFVEVTAGANERVLSDSRGSFALPLRWPAYDVAIDVFANDIRTGASGQITVNLPAALGSGQLILLN
jgi:hypothetical protein